MIKKYNFNIATDKCTIGGTNYAFGLSLTLFPIKWEACSICIQNSDLLYLLLKLMKRIREIIQNHGCCYYYENFVSLASLPY